MTENANQKGAQQKIETPSEAYGSGSASGFLPENAKKEGSDWLGGPQNGNEAPSQNDHGSDMAWSGRGKAATANIEDPPEYNAENGKQPHAAHTTSKAGRMGTGNIADVASTSTDGAYQTASHSTGYTNQAGSSDWLGGPQNGNETPSKAEKTLQEKPSSDISGPTGSGK